MSIKKIISALLVLPVLAAASCVCAEDERFAISALKAHTMERWEETYQAYGRTIDVNVPIQVPETDCVQVYIVEPMPLLTEEKQNEIKKAYEQPKNSSMRYEFRKKILNAYGACIFVWQRLGKRNTIGKQITAI